MTHPQIIVSTAHHIYGSRREKTRTTETSNYETAGGDKSSTRATLPPSIGGDAHGSIPKPDLFISQGIPALAKFTMKVLAVVARADAGIKSFDDLKGKRVNIGNPGSGQRGTMEVLLNAKGWSSDDFALATELKAAEQSAALCDNQIDAMVYTVGHPSGSIQEATTACDSVLVDVSGASVDGLIDKNSFYRSATIPGGMYRGNDADVSTFGVGATFVTSDKVSDEAVYTVVKSVMENIEDFKKLHPAFANLDPKSMATAGLSAPLHPGAAKYYKEAGLID